MCSINTHLPFKKNVDLTRGNYYTFWKINFMVFLQQSKFHVLKIGFCSLTEGGLFMRNRAEFISRYVLNLCHFLYLSCCTVQSKVQILSFWFGHYLKLRGVKSWRLDVTNIFEQYLNIRYFKLRTRENSVTKYECKAKKCR